MSKKDRQMEQLRQKDAYDTQLKRYLEAGHRKPQTRREFLSAGLISFTGTVMAPTLATLITRKAHAEGIECGTGDVASKKELPIFVNVVLAGGPALYANAMVCRANGQSFGPGTAMLGMGAGATEDRNYFANGVPIWVPGGGSPGSPMFNRFRAVLGSDTDIPGKTAFVHTSGESVDDSTTNPFEISGLLKASGLTGMDLPMLRTSSNIRFQPNNGVPIESYLPVSNVNNISDSLGFAGALGSFYRDQGKNSFVHKQLAQAIDQLNKYQIEQLARTPASHKSQGIFQKLIECASAKNVENLSKTFALSVDDDAQLAPIWARDESDANFNRILESTGHSINSCLQGFSPGLTVTLGGYDYHLGRTRDQANALDQRVGSLLARLLRSAKAKGKRMFILVTADGSVGSVADSGADASVNWIGDRGIRATNYILAYDPAGAPATEGVTVGSYRDAGFQLNHFDSEFTVADINPIGPLSNTQVHGAALFLNYLAFAGLETEIEKPQLAAVKASLTNASPIPDIFKYYGRIKGQKS